MRKLKTIGKTKVILATLLLTLVATATVELTPGIPNIFNPTESAFQNQTHFLVFTGSDTAGESATTATAYYNAINPTQSKRSFQQWLVNAGFISDPSQWHPTGPQIIACDLGPAAGCDIAAHDASGNLVYGDNIINTDSHAIVLNAADLGFVRNQFIRCVPSCSASNPKIYTYLENYPVNSFAASGNGGSGFPIKTGYPTDGEATAAIESAINRPLGKLATNPVYGGTCNDDSTKGAVTTDTVLGCNIQRIADVAFEWAPPPDNPSSTKRYGQQYAFIFSADGSGNGDAVHTRETISVPPAGFAPNLVGQVTPNVARKTLNPINAGDPFPPNLDFIGFKQHPGVCTICHGGNPQNLTTSGAYPNQGNISGFRFLPLDIRNLLFSSDSGGEEPATNGSLAFTDRLHQEAQIKEYNRQVLQTVPTSISTDGTGGKRVAHLREVIVGWYAGFPGDTTMSGNIQNGYWQTTLGRDFIPQGWLEAKDGGTAPAGSEQLYQAVLSPSCRTCHFNRAISLDFGTAANLLNQKSNTLELGLVEYCKSNNPTKGAKAMPLAHLTYQRYWQANSSTGGTTQTLPYPAPGLSISSTADQIANYFGYSNVQGYCATNP